MPLNPSRRCSDCRKNGGYSSSGSSSSSSSTSVSSDGGPLIVSSNMLKSRPSTARKAVSSSSSSTSPSSHSVTTAASSTTGDHIPGLLLPGPKVYRPERNDAFAWQVPDQSRHIPRARSHMQSNGVNGDPYLLPQSVHEDRIRHNTAAASASYGEPGLPGLQRRTTEENRMRNRDVQSRLHSSMPPRPAIPRSYGPTPYPLHPSAVMPHGSYGAMPDEGALATWRRYNEPETLDSIRLQAIFAEWERQILLGLLPELTEHKHLWSSFVKRFHSDPPVLDMHAEVQRHTERLERESAENLRANARRQKKTVEELARIDRSRKAYHGNPNIRAPKPKHPVPDSGVPKSRL